MTNLRWPVRAANSKLPYRQQVTIVILTNRKLCWQTASYVDKQQVILTNNKLFWQTTSYFNKQQVILTNNKLFWQQQVILTNSKKCNFDKEQVILTNSN